jgi:hypothetical protein
MRYENLNVSGHYIVHIELSLLRNALIALLLTLRSYRLIDHSTARLFNGIAFKNTRSSFSFVEIYSFLTVVQPREESNARIFVEYKVLPKKLQS